jgi:hypothetical protein
MTVIVGITVGAFLRAAHEIDWNLQEKWWLHQFFSPYYSGNTLFEVFKNDFLLSAIVLSAVLSFGFFAIGQPLGVMILIMRGVGIGVSIADIYIQSGTDGILPVLVMVIPKAVVLSFILSLAVREMFRMSYSLLVFLFRNGSFDEKIRQNVRLYFIRFAVLFILSTVVAVADAAANYFFMDIL